MLIYKQILIRMLTALPPSKQVKQLNQIMPFQKPELEPEQEQEPQPQTEHK
jgi:hypothetical protein